MSLATGRVCSTGEQGGAGSANDGRRTNPAGFSVMKRIKERSYPEYPPATWRTGDGSVKSEDATLRLIFNCPLDRRIQCHRVDRLDQVFQKTGFLALRFIGLRAEPAHRDAPQAIPGVQFLE